MSSPPIADQDHLSSVAPLSPKQLWVALAGLMMAILMASLDQNIVSTALPRIAGEMGGLAHISWVVTAFMLASTATTPLYGKLSDIFGRKAMFMIAIAIFLAGSVLCGQARNMLQLILFRGVQGLGAGGLMVLTQAAIGDLVGPMRRSRYTALFSIAITVSSVAGPLLGGIITDALSWRWIFYVNLPIGALATVLINRGLRHPNRSVSHHIDYVGALLLVAGTCASMLMLSWGGVRYSWSSWTIIALAILSLILFALLALCELNAQEPILPPNLLRNRTFMLATGGIAFTSMGIFGAMIFLPVFFQVVLGASPSRAGLMIAPLMGGMITASFVVSRVSPKTGRYKRYPVAGLTVASLAYLILAWLARNSTSVVYVELNLATIGLGLGLIMPNLTVAIQNAVAHSDLGVATSASAFLRSLAGMIGVAISGAIVAGRLDVALSGGQGSGTMLDQGTQHILTMPAEQRDLLIGAYRSGISLTFLAAAIILSCALMLVLSIPERLLSASRLRGGVTAQPDKAAAE